VKFFEFVYKPLYRDKDFLYQKYVIEGLSSNEISRLIPSSRSAVMTYLRLFGFPLKRADQKNKSRIAYGEAWRNRQVVVHKKEQELIEKMKKLRAEGLSYWKIADALNVWGIPTKTQKGKWSAKQVHQILIRVILSSVPKSGAS
jgi:hypothetical protein